MNWITKTTCLKAYNTNLYVDADGMSRLCCKQKHNLSLEGGDNTRFKLWVEKDRWNYIDEIRSYMEKWEWHPSCIACKKMEEYGSESVRQIFNKQFYQKKQEIRNTRESIKYLEINFSNACNLSCRMCSSKSSTWRIAVERHLWKDPVSLMQLDKEALSYLHDLNNIYDIKDIRIFWWEPLMEKEHFRFLAFLIKQDLAKDIFLWYNSNLTIIPKFSKKEQDEYVWAKDIFDLWKYFKRVELKPSIDGYGKVDEYIRVWSKWTDVIENIKTIKARWLPNLYISVWSTIQIDNVLTYPEFLLYMMSTNTHHTFSSHGFVMWPEYLCIQNLPKPIKKYIHMKYEKFLSKHPMVWQKYWKYMNQVLKFMDAKDMGEEKFQRYLVVTKMLDNFHKIEEGNSIVGLYNKLCIK